MNLAKRFDSNPIIRPADVPASWPDLKVTGAINPGAFEFDGRIGLLLRVCESLGTPTPDAATPVIADPSRRSGYRCVEISRRDPLADFSDPRLIFYGDTTYLTTLSHLRLAWSDDGEKFTVDEKPTIWPAGELETFGLEDCRVAKIGDTYYLTCTAVSSCGVGVAMMKTRDWKEFERCGMILPPHNKDCAIFTEKVRGKFACLHRPVSADIGGLYIWYASSPDGVHWGDHKCVMRTRSDKWDSARVGAGAAPIRTDKGWLEIYHGADDRDHYGLGAVLLDIDQPWKVLAQTDDPIMTPDEPYEKCGFFGNVVFTGGHIVRGDELIIYYGAGDSVTAGAKMSIKEILDALE